MAGLSVTESKFMTRNLTKILTLETHAWIQNILL